MSNIPATVLQPISDDRAHLQVLHEKRAFVRMDEIK